MPSYFLSTKKGHTRTMIIIQDNYIEDNYMQNNYSAQFDHTVKES